MPERGHEERTGGKRRIRVQKVQREGVRSGADLEQGRQLAQAMLQLQRLRRHPHLHAHVCIRRAGWGDILQGVLREKGARKRQFYDVQTNNSKKIYIYDIIHTFLINNNAVQIKILKVFKKVK